MEGERCGVKGGKGRVQGRESGGKEERRWREGKKAPRAATPPFPRSLTQPGRDTPSPSIRMVVSVCIRPQVTSARCEHWMRIVHVPVRFVSFFALACFLPISVCGCYGGAFSCFRQSVLVHPFQFGFCRVLFVGRGMGVAGGMEDGRAEDVRNGILNGQVTVPAPLPGGPKVTVVLVKGRRSMAARQSGRVG